MNLSQDVVAAALNVGGAYIRANRIADFLTAAGAEIERRTGYSRVRLAGDTGEYRVIAEDGLMLGQGRTPWLALRSAPPAIHGILLDAYKQGGC